MSCVPEWIIINHLACIISFHLILKYFFDFLNALAKLSGNDPKLEKTYLRCFGEPSYTEEAETTRTKT